MEHVSKVLQMHKLPLLDRAFYAWMSQAQDRRRRILESKELFLVVEVVREQQDLKQRKMVRLSRSILGRILVQIVSLAFYSAMDKACRRRRSRVVQRVENLLAVRLLSAAFKGWHTWHEHYQHMYPPPPHVSSSSWHEHCQHKTAPRMICAFCRHSEHLQELAHHDVEDVEGVCDSFQRHLTQPATNDAQASLHQTRIATRHAIRVALNFLNGLQLFVFVFLILCLCFGEPDYWLCRQAKRLCRQKKKSVELALATSKLNTDKAWYWFKKGL